MNVQLVSTLLIGQAARLILAQQLEKMRAAEPILRANQDAEGVHDMRVACRRMKSAFRLLRPYLAPKRVKNLQPVLEELRDLLGAARNLDVVGAALAAYQAKVAPAEDVALKRVQSIWHVQRMEYQTALEIFLDSAAFADWVTHMQEFVNEPDEVSQLRVADAVPGMVWNAYGVVRAFETRMATANAADLHALRIDLKRLRYTLEFFREPLSAENRAAPDPKELIAPLVTLQDCLGGMQDAVVAQHALTEIITRELQSAVAGDEFAFRSVLRYHAYLHSQIESLRAELPAHFQTILDFAYREKLGLVTARL